MDDRLPKLPRRNFIFPDPHGDILGSFISSISFYRSEILDEIVLDAGQLISNTVAQMQRDTAQMSLDPAWATASTGWAMTSGAFYVAGPAWMKDRFDWANSAFEVGRRRLLSGRTRILMDYSPSHDDYEATRDFEPPYYPIDVVLSDNSRLNFIAVAEHYGATLG